MKKVILASIFIFILTLSSIAFAGPLADYSQGKMAIDINLRPSSDLEYSAEGETVKLDGKSNNLEFGITAGLGNKFAFQYQNIRANTKKYFYNDGFGHGELKAQEFNVLYQLGKNCSAFVGYTTAKPSVKDSGLFIADIETAENIGGKTTGGIQVGFIGTTQLDKKLTGYAILAAGNKITKYQLGLAYEVSKDIDLNVFYKDTKFKDLKFAYAGETSPEFDMKAKGIGYGITFKF